VPLLPMLKIPPLPCWLAVHREIRGNPLVRRVYDYMDYSVLTPETVFSLNRPIATEDGRSAKLVPGPWDGVYR
jgi:hypothetical protein